MNVDSIKRGIVLDHIRAGRSMDIYKYLHLDELDCSVAIDLDVLGYLDPGITVNIIKDGHVVEKKHVALPRQLVNVVRCRNPRCITTAEPALDQVFRLSDEKNGTYRCLYCDAECKR